jgi:hypothetical protein
LKHPIIQFREKHTLTTIEAQAWGLSRWLTPNGVAGVIPVFSLITIPALATSTIGRQYEEWEILRSTVRFKNSTEGYLVCHGVIVQFYALSYDYATLLGVDITQDGPARLPDCPHIVPYGIGYYIHQPQTTPFLYRSPAVIAEWQVDYRRLA